MNYSIKAAAMATGVNESRLRTWERRYGIPRPDRSAKGQRQFDDGDLMVIRRMSVLINSGVRASDAAEVVLAEGPAEGPEPSTPKRAHPLVDLLVQKALDLDAGWVARIVHDSIFSTGWAPTMERVVFPALSRLTRYWGEARTTLAHVRFTHELIRSEIAAEFVRLGQPEDSEHAVMLSCVEDDEYDVAAMSLALLLRLVDLPVMYLGRSVPCHDLIQAAKQVKPQAVCIIGTRRASPGVLNRCARALVASRVQSQLFVGGSVLTRRDAPEIPGMHLPQSLTAAAERIEQSLKRA
ncbi:MAG TPA: MerR family transcriptional regulator [Acidobacteriota bacterium]|nr:MerR family transcriptional regulator [Acidobacteriota bacterium]